MTKICKRNEKQKDMHIIPLPIYFKIKRKKSISANLTTVFAERFDSLTQPTSE